MPDLPAGLIADDTPLPDGVLPEALIADEPPAPADLDYDVLADPESRARLRTASANALSGANDPTVAASSLGVQPLPSKSVHLTAFQAAQVHPGAATQSLALSQKTGLAPQFVANNLDTVSKAQDQKEVAAKLAGSPVVNAYAAQSAVHAAAIKADLDSMTAVEYWLTGKWQDLPGPAIGAVGPYETSQPTHQEMVAPPVWQSGLAKFGFGVGAGLLDIKKAAVGLTTEEAGRRAEDVEYAGAPVAGAAGSSVRNAGAMAAEALPALLTAPGSKPAQAAFFTMQAFPGYYRELGYAIGEDGLHRYSDGEAKLIAGGAALATGVGSTLLGGAFLKAIPGAAGKLNGLLGESIVQAFTENPTLAKVAAARVAQAVPHMASGVAMMTAAGSVNGAVKSLADGHSLLSSEGLAEIGSGAKDGAKAGAVLSLLALYGAGKRFQSDMERLRGAGGPEVAAPEAPIGEGPTIGTTTVGEMLVTDLGRATDSATEVAQLDGMVTAASASKLVRSAPAEAQRLFASMAQAGQHDTVFIHPQAAGDPAVAQAIDAALGDGGQARALAESTGSTIPVPIEKYLTQIAPDHHDAIRDHVKLTPDGMTPNEAQQALPELQKQMASLSEPFTVEKLNAIAQRGMGKAPTEDEINATLEQLRGLGFQVADVPKVVTGGTEDVAGATSGGGAGQPPSPPAAVAVAPPPPPDRSAKYAESAKTTVNSLPVGQIHPAQFALSARTASDRISRVQAAAIENLAKATSIAQEGIDTGIESGTEGQRAAREARYAREADWLKGVRADITHAALAGELEQTLTDLARRYSGDENALDAIRKIRKASKTQTHWLAGLQGNAPGILKERGEGVVGGLYDAGGTRMAEGAPRPGTPEYIETQKHNAKIAEQESKRAYSKSERLQTEAERKSEASERETGRAGDKLSDLPDMIRERDFSRAMAKHAAEVKAEMAKALASIKRIAASREIRGQLGLAHPAFRDVFDAIAEAVGVRRPQAGLQRQSVDQLLQVMADKNLPAPFDEEALKDIVSDPRAWKDLTPVEARQSATAAASIVKMALDMTRVEIGARKLALVEAKANVVQENALRKDLGAPAATQSAREALEVVDAGLSTVNAWNLKPEVTMQALGPTMHGVFLKSIEGRNLKQKLQGDILANVMENVGEIGWIKEPLKTPSVLKMPRIGDKALAPRPVTLPATLAAKYGSTPQEWEALLNDKALPELLPSIRERLERVMEEWKKAQTVASMPDLADKYNKETMAMLFLNLGSASNEQRLTSGYNWSGQTIRSEIGKHLTLEQVDQLQGILNLLDKQLWPLVRDHVELTTGIAPPKVQAQKVTIQFADGRSKTYEGGYFPAAPHPDAIDARAVDKAAYAARTTVAASFTKERAQQASYPLNLNWRQLPSHIDAVLHYLAYDEPVRDISKLLDDGAVQMVARHSIGDANLKKLTNWRDVLAVGRVDNTGPMARVMGKTLRSRAVTNALSMNLPIAYMQASHIPYAVLAGEISATNTVLAAGKQVPFTQQWIDLRNELTELQFRSTRWAEQYRTAMSGETSLLKGKVGREIDHYAFLHMEAADAVVSHVIGDAALNDAIEKGMERDAAREYANAKIRLLMPTHNVFEMSALGRNPGFVGTVALFRGLSTVVWNINYGLFDRARQARFRASQPPSNAPRLPDEINMEEAPDGTWGMKTKANMYSAGNLLRMFSATAVLGTLGYVLAGHGKNKDDGRGAAGWGRWGFRTAAASLLEAIPGGRDLAAPFIDAAVQHHDLAWALEELKRGKNTPEVQALLTQADELGKMVSHKTTTPQKVQAGTNATMAMAGIGVRPLTAMGVNAVGGNPKMRRSRGFFDRASQFVYPTRTNEKTWLNGIEDLITHTE